MVLNTFNCCSLEKSEFHRSSGNVATRPYRSFNNFINK